MFFSSVPSLLSLTTVLAVSHVLSDFVATCVSLMSSLRVQLGQNTVLGLVTRAFTPFGPCRNIRK